MGSLQDFNEEVVIRMEWLLMEIYNFLFPVMVLPFHWMVTYSRAVLKNVRHLIIHRWWKEKILSVSPSKCLASRMTSAGTWSATQCLPLAKNQTAVWLVP